MRKKISPHYAGKETSHSDFTEPNTPCPDCRFDAPLQTQAVIQAELTIRRAARKDAAMEVRS